MENKLNIIKKISFYFTPIALVLAVLAIIFHYMKLTILALIFLIGGIVFIILNIITDIMFPPIKSEEAQGIVKKYLSKDKYVKVYFIGKNYDFSEFSMIINKELDCDTLEFEAKLSDYDYYIDVHVIGKNGKNIIITVNPVFFVKYFSFEK